jgi:hypothetical protein
MYFACPHRFLPNISHIAAAARGNITFKGLPAMNARTVPAGQAKAVAPAPRFDAKFIEEHKLIERYLENKLPLKGAVDLENWCRAHPEYLDKLKLSERAQAS